MRERMKRSSQGKKKGRGLLAKANVLVPLVEVSLKILVLILRIVKIL